jgi:hypothetical protein
MSSQQQFAYEVSTALPRDRVWALFADLENWPKFSRVYDHLKWSGVPWRRASVFWGRFTSPIQCPFDTS